MSAPTPKVPDLPTVTVEDKAQLQRFMDALREVVQTREGRRGDPLDKAVTFRDLLGLNLASKGPGGGWTGTGGGQPGPPGPPGPPGEDGTPYVPDYTAPPSPANLTAVSMFRGALIEWDAPTYTVGHGNAFTDVYVAQYGGTGPLPTFASAVLAGKTGGLGTMYLHAAAMGAQLHVWAKHVTVDGVESATAAGGINGVQITIGKVGNSDLGPLIIEAENLASGAVTASKLAAQAIELTKFANGIEPVRVVSSVPSTSNGSAVLFNTTDGKLYRWNGSAYVATVPAGDLSGLIGGGNLLFNSGFRSHAGGLPTGWSAYNNAGISATYQVSSGGLRGQNFVRVTANAATTQQLGWTTSVALGAGVNWQGGQTHYITFWARASSAQAAGIYLSAEYANHTWAAFAYPELPLLQNGVWVRYVMRAVPTAGNSWLPDGQFYISWLVGGGGVGSLPAGASFDITIPQVEIADAPSSWAPKPDELLPGSITATEIANDAITTPKLVAGAVVAGKIAAGAVTAGTIAAGAVTANELAANSVTAGKIAAGAVAAEQIAAGAITTGKLLVTGAGAAINDDPLFVDVDFGSVWSPAFTPGQAIVSKLDQPGPGGRYQVELYCNAGTHFSQIRSRVFPCAQGKTFRLSFWANKISGSTASSNTYARIVEVTSTGAIAGGSSYLVTQEFPAAGTFENFNVSQTWLRYRGFRTIQHPDTVGFYIEFLGSYHPTANTNIRLQDLRVEEYIGADLIVDGAIIANKLAANAIAVGSAAIQDGAIRNALIENLAVDSAKIANGAILSAKIQDAAITTAKIQDAAITDAKIANLSADKITAGTIAAARIGAGTIDASKINVTNLSALSANMGAITAGSINIANRIFLNSDGTFLLRSNATGAGGRQEVTGAATKVFDAAGTKRVQFGDLSA